jgi:molybdopterin molybdotransferase
MGTLIPLDEARAYVLANCTVLDPVAIPVSEASGRVIAEPVICDQLVPPFDNTAMDGYAVRAADVEQAGEAAVSLRVVGTVHAGTAGQLVVGRGEAVRIMTGAPIPEGADAVVMVESTTSSDDGSAVEVRQAVPRGSHIRPAGDDLRPGDVVIDAGSSRCSWPWSARAGSRSSISAMSQTTAGPSEPPSPGGWPSAMPWSAAAA